MSEGDKFREIEKRERRLFKSFIWVHTEDGAHSFTAAVGERQMKVLRVEDGFDRLSKSEQLLAVLSQLRRHYLETGGRLLGFGAILAYRFADTFDRSIVLDTSGNVIEEDGERFLLPEAWWALHYAR
jgi:hypothetical protein